MKKIKILKPYKRMKIYIQKKQVGVNLVDKIITVKGPLGEIKHILRNQYDGDLLYIKNKELNFLSKIIKKLIHSVTVGWYLELDLNGVGYKAFSLGDRIALDLGYSNLIVYKTKQVLKIRNYKNKVVLFSTNEEYLKDVAFQLRCYAKPDPYKGKGILFSGEEVKLKKK